MSDKLIALHAAGEIERLLSAWRAWSAQLAHDAKYGTGDTYRSYRRTELDAVAVCVGDLQKVYEGLLSFTTQAGVDQLEGTKGMECPACGAPPGEACVGTREGRYHNERIRASYDKSCLRESLKDCHGEETQT